MRLGYFRLELLANIPVFLRVLMSHLIQIGFYLRCLSSESLDEVELDGHLVALEHILREGILLLLRVSCFYLTLHF